jgi:hypothetical protein
MLAAAIALLAFINGGSTTAQDETGRYFEETGHWVTGDFYTAYLSIPNPDEIYGNPLTEAFQNQLSRRYIQYFERAVFELHLERPAELQVQRSHLGRFLYEPGQEISIPPNSPACQTFEETGKQVCYAFLNYFHKNGGVIEFGFPISNVEIREGRIVQWFQRARFDWRPELESGQRVKLANLGVEYFETIKEDPIRKEPADAGNLPRVITRLDVRGFVTQAVVPTQGGQTVYVIVQDQKFEPVPNAEVTLTVRYPSGSEYTLLMPITNEDGITWLDFDINESQQGIVEIIIRASINTLKQTTRTSFRIWW